jgi:predicted metalloprotease
MKWEDYRKSDNVEDRRGEGSGGGGFSMGGAGRLGIGGLIVVGLISWALGIDPRILIGGLEMIQGGGQQPYQQPYQQPRQQPYPQPYQQPNQQSRVPAPGPGQAPARPGAPQDQQGQFAAAALAQTEDVWSKVFATSGKNYTNPRMVLFSGRTQSGCGTAQSAMGPFYCPQDRRLYLDLTFFRDLRDRFHAPGEFAAAYVIAHEVGHHVQNLLGKLPQVQQEMSAMPKQRANALSVRLELQADCYAGVWAFHADTQLKVLQPGDVEKALAAANAIGDDRLQRQTQGTIVPDSFTHGSSQQRVSWFTTGLKSGKIESCDTFAQGAR